MTVEMEIARADLADFEAVEKIYSEARDFMRASGNPDQWRCGYPPREVILKDIEDGALFKVTEGEAVVGVFFFKVGDDPTYLNIFEGEWKSDSPYAVIHRVATSKSARGRGVGKIIFDYCFDIFPNLKIDTHRDNIPMQRALAKAGFEYCGIIYLSDGSERLAYQKI